MFETLAFPATASPPAGDTRPPASPARASNAADPAPKPFKEALAAAETAPAPEAPPARETTPVAEPLGPDATATPPAALLEALAALLAPLTGAAPVTLTVPLTEAPAETAATTTAPAAPANAAAQVAELATDLLSDTAVAAADTQADSALAEAPADFAARLLAAVKQADVAKISDEAGQAATAEALPEVRPAKAAGPAASVTVDPAAETKPHALTAAATPVNGHATPTLIEPARLAEAQAPAVTVTPEIVLPQIVRGVEGLARSGATSMQLQLYPDNLGRIEVRLTAGADGLRVTLTADQAATGSLLQQNLSDLRHSFSTSGLSLSGLSVDIGQGQAGQTFGWHRQPPAAPPAAAGDPEADNAAAAERAPSLALNGAGRRVDYRI